MTERSTALITGASTGIGATYADRLAGRGHDLLLVARDAARMHALAEGLRRAHGVAVEVLPADLTDAAGLAAVEARLREDGRIGMLVNNAGMGLAGSFLTQSAGDLARLVALNVMAPVRLASAVAPRLAAAGRGAIINIGSVVGLAPELGMAAYGGTKALILHLSQSMALELEPRGVRVQAVLPAVTRTELWGRAGVDLASMEGVMEVGELVDAALAGFDAGETVTIPPLPDAAMWAAMEAARQAMIPNFRQRHAAARYRRAA